MAYISASGTGCAAPTPVLGILRARMPGHNGRKRLGAMALALLAVPLIGAAPVGALQVDIAQLRSAKGMIRICLTADPANFPNCVDDRDAVTRSVPADQHSIRFTALPRGDYAVAVIHDENDNKKLDTFAGIPKKGFGFSRNPAIRFGPPRFAAARFTLATDAEEQQVRMRFIL